MLWRPDTVSEPDVHVAIEADETPHHPRQSADHHLRVWASMGAWIR